MITLLMEHKNRSHSLVLDAASDDDFDAVADQTVSVTTTDDDVAGFTIAETEGINRCR